MNINKQIKGLGLYAYGSYVAAVFFPPVLALHGQYFGFVLYSLLAIPIITIGKQLVKDIGLFFIFFSVLLYLLSLANHALDLGYFEIIRIVVLFFGGAVLISLLKSIHHAYKNGRF